MKRILVILVLLCAVGALQAQPTKHVAIQQTLSAVGAGETFQFGGSYVGVGLRYHAISCQIFGGAVSASSLDLEGSNDKTTWTDIITALDCSSATSSAVTAGYARYLRLKLNTFTTATGTPRLDIYYAGYWDNPSTSSATMQGVVNIAGSTYADGTTQTARIATDGSIFVAPQGLANASAPTFAEGALKPFSMDLSGAIRATITNLTTDSAHGAAFTENPVGVGLEGLSTERAAVDATDKVKAAGTTTGVVITQSGALPGDFWEYSAETNGTTWATIKAPAADYYYVVTFVKVVNSDATVGTKVTFYDDDDGDIGDAVVKDGGYAAALGGGWVAANPSGVFSTGTANHGLYIVCASDSSETHVTVRGYRTKIKPVS